MLWARYCQASADEFRLQERLEVARRSGADTATIAGLTTAVESVARTILSLGEQVRAHRKLHIESVSSPTASSLSVKFAVPRRVAD